MKNNNLRVVLIGAALFVACIIILCGGVYLLSAYGGCSFNPKDWSSGGRMFSVIIMFVAFVISVIIPGIIINELWKD